MSGGRRQHAVAVVAVVVVVVLGACGRRGNPVPPETRFPQAVNDLTAVAREGGIELTWTVPRRRFDNSRILEPGVVRLFRVDDAGTGDPRPALLHGDRIRGYTQIATFRLQEPPSPYLRGGRITYIDRSGLVFGRRYTYVVLTTDAQGRTGPPSARVSVTYIAPPEAPRALRGEPTDRGVRLSWQAPATLVDGSPVRDPLTYEVLRAPDPVAAPTVIGRTNPGVTSFEDRELENDRTYYYAVRAVRSADKMTAADAASERIAVTPVKTTAPAPVAGLVAVPSRGEVRLSWQPSREPDVATYILYRAAGSAPPARVGAVRPPATTFVDRNLRPGTYRYTVTAQDASARANESRPSNEVIVTVP